MVMTFKGLAKLVEEIGELSQVVGKKIAYMTGDHPDGKGDLNLRIQNEVGDVIAAIRFVSEKMKLDKINIDAIAGCKTTGTILNGLPDLARNLGTLSYSASNAMCVIHEDRQVVDEGGSLQYQMGLSLASMNFVAKSLNLDRQAIATRTARKVWQYESWDRQKP